jgi:hypothetical protein
MFMWIPFVTMFIGLIGTPSGSYDWIELPLLTRYSLLAVGIFFTATFFFLIGAPLVSWFTTRSILKTGKLAEAEILQIWDTGTTINNNPVVRIRLEVRPRLHSIFEAETEKLISRLKIPQYQPGTVVQVKYDPESQDVALVDD